MNKRTKTEKITAKPNKGITLIALVITIIIMIILVAVSVALVVKGDLFGNAQEGTEKTSIEAEKEQLTEYVYGQYRENADKKVEVNLSEVKTILNSDKDKFKGDAKIEGDKLTVTGNSGVIYTVHRNGTIGSLNEESDKQELKENFEEEYYNLSYKDLSKLDFDSMFGTTGKEGEFIYQKYFMNKNKQIDSISFTYRNGYWDIQYIRNLIETYENEDYLDVENYNVNKNTWSHEGKVNNGEYLENGYPKILSTVKFLSISEVAEELGEDESMFSIVNEITEEQLDLILNIK